MSEQMPFHILLWFWLCAYHKVFYQILQFSYIVEVIFTILGLMLVASRKEDMVSFLTLNKNEVPNHLPTQFVHKALLAEPT